MTTDERQGPAAAPASALVPNADAERAYAASVAPPPRPRLPASMTARARFAGAVGGAMLLLGLDLLGLGVLLLLAPIVLLPMLRWVATQLPEMAPVVAQIADPQPAGSGWPWLPVLIAIVGAVAACVGAWTSVRVLRSAGFSGPVRCTAAGFGVALAGRVVLNAFAVPFLSLLAPLAARGAEGLAAGGGAAAATVVAVVVLFGMHVAITSATTMIAWWLVAHLGRPAASPQR